MGPNSPRKAGTKRALPTADCLANERVDDVALSGKVDLARADRQGVGNGGACRGCERQPVEHGGDLAMGQAVDDQRRLAKGDRVLEGARPRRVLLGADPLGGPVLLADLLDLVVRGTDCAQLRDPAAIIGGDCEPACKIAPLIGGIGIQF